MLGNKSKPAPPAADTTSLIAVGTQVRGDVRFSGRLHVDGSVEGALRGEGENAVLTLSNSAQVTGEIVAPHVVINGIVSGDVTASERLELASGARVEGSQRQLRRRRVRAHRGQRLLQGDGNVRRRADQRQDRAPRRAAAAVVGAAGDESRSRGFRAVGRGGQTLNSRRTARSREDGCRRHE